MSILSPSQKSALLAVIGQAPYVGQSDQAVADLLNAPTTQSATVPAPFTIGQVLVTLSTASQANITSLPVVGHVIDSVNAQDRNAVGLYVATFAAQGKITSGEASAINAILVATTTVMSHGPTPFQSIAGLGDTPIAYPDGHVSVGTCYAVFVTEGRA